MRNIVITISILSIPVLMVLMLVGIVRLSEDLRYQNCLRFHTVYQVETAYSNGQCWASTESGWLPVEFRWPQEYTQESIEP